MSPPLLNLVKKCYQQALQRNPPAPLPSFLLQDIEYSAYRSFLHYCIQETHTKLFIELGTEEGITTEFIATLNPECRILTLEKEKCPSVKKRLSAYPNVLVVDNTSSTSDNAFLFVRQEINRMQTLAGVILQDTSHTYVQAHHEYYAYLEFLRSDGITCIDDIQLHKGMRYLWKLISHYKISLNPLHSMHQGKLDDDGFLYREGTGFGVVIPGISPELSSEEYFNEPLTILL